MPFPTPGDIPDLGIELASLASYALAGKFFTTESPGKPSGALSDTKPLHSLLLVKKFSFSVLGLS